MKRDKDDPVVLIAGAAFTILFFALLISEFLQSIKELFS